MPNLQPTAPPTDQRKLDGGPAFPQEYGGGRGAPGMSLRDWFAGQAPAMPFDVRRQDGENDHQYMKRLAALTAEWEFIYADAMLAAREGK